MSTRLKKIGAGCDIWGKHRLDLAIYIRDNILNTIYYTWFIENGTLLGAWRNNSFIAHDDDFDIGILIDSEFEILNIFKQIYNSLNNKYKVRLVNTYASKLEIYDESYGAYILPGEKYNGHDFHYVTLDIQFYLKKGNLYECLYFINPNKRLIDKTIISPTKHIILEGESFNSPSNTEQFLIKSYGSIDTNATYNPETGLYEI